MAAKLDLFLKNTELTETTEITFSQSKSIFKSISEVELSIQDRFQRHDCATISLKS